MTETLIDFVEERWALDDEPIPAQGPRELAERRGEGGLVVRLVYTRDATGGPQTLVHVWEAYESTEPDLVVPVAPEKALDAFWHPYAYAARP